MTTESLKTRQIQMTSVEGVERVSLTSADDLEGERIAPAAGLIVRDKNGRERGGIGVLDLPEGTRVLCALDHAGGDAVGMMVDDDGTAGFFINDAPEPEHREPRAQRFSVEIAHDGTPELALRDTDGRPRLRLTLTDDGAGAIEFLTAGGDVVERIIPEESGETP